MSTVTIGGVRVAINPERFWVKVDKTGTCWLWTAYRDGEGYGRFRLTSTNTTAHRIAYELLVGPIPEGLHLDHLCRVRACVNPEHLEPVTPCENVRRSEPATRTHCPQNHPYDEANTYRRGINGRACRTCRRQGEAARRLAMAGAA